LLNKSSCLAPALGVTKFTADFGHTLLDLMFNILILRDRFVKQKLMLSSSFGYHRIYSWFWSHFVGLDVQHILLRGWYVKLKSMLSGVTKFITIIAMILITQCCVTYIRLRCSSNSLELIEQKLMPTSSFLGVIR
jgi:hypothetical protein